MDDEEKKKPFAFIPAGLLYGWLAQTGRASILWMSLCLALSLPLANVVWKWSGPRKVSTAEVVLEIAQALENEMSRELDGVVILEISNEQSNELPSPPNLRDQDGGNVLGTPSSVGPSVGKRRDNQRKLVNAVANEW